MFLLTYKFKIREVKPNEKGLYVMGRRERSESIRGPILGMVA